MNLGARSPKQMALAGVLGVLALGAVVYTGIQVEETFGGGSSTPSAPAPATVSAPAEPQESIPAATPAGTEGRAAKPMGTTSAALDPTLHMEAMLVSESVVYSGSGRNIFSPNSAPPVVIQRPIAPARPVAALAPGPPPPPAGPPPPPPIDLKFFGTETLANGEQQAFLLHDDNVYLAAAGDIVLRRYRVISINARTVQMEDLQNKNTQFLPLMAN
jgi:hypothetical protein